MPEDSGQNARWAHRQNAYVPILPIRMNAEGQSKTARQPEVVAATEGPLSRGYRHSGHVEVSFESQVTLAKSLTSFGMTEGRIK